ncbi:MAG TPA: B12-binding domain-containing radical SAM protein [Bacteroidetes bacterium]|nr:B12-binding domain-containing radical SAM protein [Bacteroidota bacterium]
MKVLFTHSYFLRFDPKMWKQQQPYPPLGTIYAAALLRENGYDCSLFDVMFVESPEEIQEPLRAESPDVLVIYDDGFNYLTKMCLTNMREAAFRMTALAKERGCKVLVCSSDSTDHFDKYLDAGADAVILGEGEMGLLETVNLIRDGGTDYGPIKGLAFRVGEETICTDKRPVMRDLDELPAPAWDLIKIQPYQQAWSQHGYFTINMATTRGCPYKCSWCAKPIYGNRYHSHSPAAKAAELQYLIDNFQAEYVWFCDDIFGLKPGWVLEFADEIEKRGLKIKFKIQSRADLLLQDDTVAALARAGCDEVWMGAESGSQKILDAMDKGISLAEIKTSREMLAKHGIRAAFFLQFGYLGETQEDIQATFHMLAETMPDDIGVSVSYPLPGTKFYDIVAHELDEKQNWEDSDELALMFRNHHSPEYYKRLHRFVHKHYRKLQGYQSLRRLFRGNTDQHTLRRIATIPYYIPAAWLESQRLNRLKHD